MKREYWVFSWDGSAAGSCGGMHSNLVENRASVAFSGPISRCYVVLELCGMDLSIFVQVEHSMYAMFGCYQGVGTGHPQLDKLAKFVSASRRRICTGVLLYCPSFL